MNRHLISIEVGIKRRTYKRMKSDCLSRHQLDFEGFNRKSMKCWRTVKQHILILNYFFQKLERNRISLFNQLFSLFWSIYDLLFNKLSNNKRSKHLYCDIDWKSTFIQIQARTYSNNRSSWIVNSLSKQVLSENSLLTWKHIRNWLENFDSSTSLSCRILLSNQKIIDRFLKKSDFILFYDIRHSNLDHFLKSDISHQNSSIEKIHIRWSKSSSIKLNYWSNIRWDHRKLSHDHIFWLYSRDIEINQQFDQTHHLLFLISRSNSWKLLYSLFNLLFYINRLKHLEDSFRTWCKWD